jgi:hypothetical protein
MTRRQPRNRRNISQEVSNHCARFCGSAIWQRISLRSPQVASPDATVKGLL